jgi:hypothetical protein
LGKAIYPRSGKQRGEQRSVAQQESEKQESGKRQRGTEKDSLSYEVTITVLDIQGCVRCNFAFSGHFVAME